MNIGRVSNKYNHGGLKTYILLDNGKHREKIEELKTSKTIKNILQVIDIKKKKKNLSLLSVCTLPSLLMISIPLQTLPNIVCFPGEKTKKLLTAKRRQR